MVNKLFIRIIKLYQRLLSPILGNNCRHIPSCSNYSIEAYQKHNFFYATYLTIYRILRCNPFGSCGFDPVPEKKHKHKH